MSESVRIRLKLKDNAFSNRLSLFYFRKMEGEKIKIFGYKHIHYEKRIKSSDFQPKFDDLKAVKRRYWYNYFLYNTRVSRRYKIR